MRELTVAQLVEAEFYEGPNPTLAEVQLWNDLDSCPECRSEVINGVCQGSACKAVLL